MQLSSYSILIRGEWGESSFSFNLQNDTCELKSALSTIILAWIVAGIMEEFWIVLKSAREVSLVHRRHYVFKPLQKCCVYRTLESSTKLNSFEN